MRLDFQQQLRMEQRLLQSPQMIQAMQVLQLTTPELMDRIQAELEENPFLEVEDPPVESAPAASSVTDPRETASSEDEPPLDDLPDLSQVDQLFDRGGRGSGTSSGSGEEHWDAVQNLAAPEHPRAETILGELRVSDASPMEIEIAEELLADLDLRGFLPEGLETFAERHGFPLELATQALQRLRAIAHPAIGARDLRECYLLQLAAIPEDHPVATALVRDHFDELLSNRLPQIAKALGVGMSEVREALDVLRELDSRPLSEYLEDPTLSILPDVLVEPDDRGGYRVRLARDGLPELRLSRSAQELLSKARKDKRLHAFLMKKIERARWFLDAVAQRRRSLLSIAKVLVSHQREYLDYGPERLRPLKMQEVADIVGVHISTVSRAIRGKWAQTPQGILPLKNFFSGGQDTSGGGQTSRVAIQERVKEIVAAEDKSAPYSDEEIVRILHERNGVKVARRTVTKYRKALGIPSSTIRRSFAG